MGTALLLFAAWCIGCMIFAEIVPPALEALWYVLCYLFECFGVALKYLFIGLFRAIVWLAKQGWRGLLSLMQARESQDGTASENADEGEGQSEAEDAAEEPQPAPRPAPDPYQVAIRLLGLEPGFSRTALSRAYKQAMKHAHPDAGGSTRKAQAVNAARDLLKRTHGWA